MARLRSSRARAAGWGPPSRVSWRRPEPRSPWPVATRRRSGVTRSLPHGGRSLVVAADMAEPRPGANRQPGCGQPRRSGRSGQQRQFLSRKRDLQRGPRPVAVRHECESPRTLVPLKLVHPHMRARGGGDRQRFIYLRAPSRHRAGCLRDLKAASRYLRKRCAKSGRHKIQVNCIAPGVVKLNSPHRSSNTCRVQ